MRVTRTSAPEKEPINLDEAKDHIRLDGDDDDAYLMALVVAAREMTELRTRRSLITQTWELSLDRFPDANEIWIPKPPLQSITSIQYEDETGTTQTFSPASYYVDTVSTFGRVALEPGQSWPGTEARANAVTVTFVAGYGDDAHDLPQSLRQALLFVLAHWYENREPVIVGGPVSKIPDSYATLCWAYRADGFPRND
jgi:uncharacterized phiE125 gp8 family phage protein